MSDHTPEPSHHPVKAPNRRHQPRLRQYQLSFCLTTTESICFTVIAYNVKHARKKLFACIQQQIGGKTSIKEVGESKTFGLTALEYCRDFHGPGAERDSPEALYDIWEELVNQAYLTPVKDYRDVVCTVVPTVKKGVPHLELAKVSSS